MNCFNHTDTPAVAQCTNCGKFLCKECATKYSPILCDDCAGMVVQEQEQAEAKAEMSENNRFKLAIALLCLNFLVYFILGITKGMFSFKFLLFILIDSIAWGGAPYGWKKLNSVNLNVILILPIIGWFIYFGVKLSLSRLIGWIFFLKEIVNRIGKSHA